MGSINKNAERKAEQIAQNAKKNAEGYEAKALAEMERSFGESVAKAKSEAAQLLSSMKARSDMAARQLYNAELEARISDAFDWLRKSLPDYAKTKDYTALLKKLASMASEELGDGCRLLVRKEDLQKLKGVKGAEAGVDSKSAGGLVGVSADGRRYIDFTLETLLNEIRDRLEVRFVKEIEG